MQRRWLPGVALAMGALLLGCADGSVAEERYDYVGVEIVYAEIADEVAAGGLMLLLGAGVRYDDYASVALEAAVGCAGEYEGPVVKGGAIFQLNSPPLGRTSLFVFGGPTVAILAQEKCHSYLINPSAYSYYYETECDMSYQRSVGGSAGIGLRLKGMHGGSLQLRYAYYRGDNFTSMHALTLSLSD